MDDIEDLGQSPDEASVRLQRDRTAVKLQTKRNKIKRDGDANKGGGDADTNKSERDADPVRTDSFVPGTASVHVKTWGCAHNSSDGEYMSGLLAAEGYSLTDLKEEADVWLLNSCAVKNPAEDHFRNEVELAHKLGKRVVAAGCVSQGRPGAGYLDGVSIVGVQQIDRVVEVVEETLKGNTVRLTGAKRREDGRPGRKAGGAALALPKVRRNPLIEIIAISTGCLNQCTYCKTKHARGDLGSYPPEEIVERARQSFTEGVVEVWLTSEDTGAYGRDIDTDLPSLLRQLVEVIPDGCRLRLGMTNPPYILDHLDEMAEILKHPRVYSFLHVPVQSGSDAVLRDMRREYNVDDFSRVVNILRKKVPGITIATDIICGFPTETDQDFDETMILCRKYKFPSLFINQFFPRPGTPAAKMGVRVPTKEVKRRTRVLSDFFQSYRPYDGRVGHRYEVLVTETSHDKLHYVGHNQFYEQVLVPKEDRFLGKLVPVEIESVTKFSMKGRPIADINSTKKTKAKKAARNGAAAGGVGNKNKKGYQQVMHQHWIYWFSVVVLALAIVVRLAQVLYVHVVRGPAVINDATDTNSGLK